MTNNDDKLEDVTLEEVHGSDYCQYSVIENKLAKLYRNQVKIFDAIKLIGRGES